MDGFAADTLTYTATGTTVTAASTDNAGITVLPVLDDVVHILTISEDGSSSRTYAVTLTGEASHEHVYTSAVKIGRAHV